MFKKSKGFTLLEILLVVGIIAVLASIVIIAINPSRQLAQVRNTQRLSDLKQINNALVQYYIDHSSYPTGASTLVPEEICNTGNATSVDSLPLDYCNGLADLTALVPTYLVAIPTDSLGSPIGLIQTAYAASTKGTGYKLFINNAENKIILRSLQIENNIAVSLGADPVVAALRGGLVGYWPLNGDYKDYSEYVQNRDGVMNGAGSSFGSGRVGDSLVMPGADTYDGTFLDLPKLEPEVGTGPFSFSLWIKPYITGPFDRANIFLLGEAFGPQFEVEYGVDPLNNTKGAVFTACYAECNNNISLTKTSLEGNWHQVSVVYDGASNIKLYFDGAYAYTTNSCPINITNSLLQLGYREYYGGNTFKGNLDEFAMWNRVLSDQEIKTLYNNGNGKSLLQ